MKEAVWACNPADGLAEAEAAVREAKMRRLRVIDEPERLIGPHPLADPVQHSDGRLLKPAGLKHRLNPGTVALRWCSGCRRFLGVKLWPRTDRVLVHTHGLCTTCFRRMTTDALTDPVLFVAEQAGGAGDEPPL